MKIVDGVVQVEIDKDPELIIKYSYYEETKMHQFVVSWPQKNWWGHSFHSHSLEKLGQKLAQAIKEATD